LRDQALDLAPRRDHPAYDRFHVALAMREAGPLPTADRRLAQRFGGDVEVRLPAA
jgi:predicted nucleic acid-binding protein